MISPRLTNVTVARGVVLDLVFEDGKLKTATNGTQAAQNFAQRLQDYRGVYSLNGYLSGLDDEGTWAYERIFNTAVSDAERQLEIMRRLFSTPGFDSMARPLNWDLQDNHTLLIDGHVNSEWGEIDASQELEAL
jgi:hypothetical protein